MSAYNELFYDYINIGAKRSAQELLPLLIDALSINSVLDVGCGQGAWLDEYSRNGIETIFGIDGDYVDLERLLIDKSSFAAVDLAESFHLNKRYDLVQSLEVAEHLPKEYADQFISNLVSHGDMILFSAAVKGQGGDHHVNEQSYDYWRKKFSNHGYEVFDCIRPMINDNDAIEPWYRYNMFLYVSSSADIKLPNWIREKKVPLSTSLKDISPSLYKVRKLFVRIIPYTLKNKLAKFKAKLSTKTR